MNVASATGTYNSAGYGNNIGLTWNVTLGGEKGANYTVTSASGTGTISKRPVTIKPKEQTVEIGGSVSSTSADVEVTAGSLASGQSISSVTLNGDTSAVTDNGETEITAAVIHDSGSADVTANYDITLQKGKLIVTKAAPVYTAPAIKSLTYNGQGQELITGGNTSDGYIYYALLSSADATPSGSTLWSSSLPIGTDAKSYYVWWKLMGDNDHRNINPIKLEAVINKKDLTVTANPQTITYGESISNTAADYTAGDPVNGETLTVTLTADIAAGKISPQAVVKKEGVDKTGNYNLTLTDGILTINPAPLTVTPASGQTKVYGDSDSTLTYTAEGFVNGDSASVITGALARDAGENAGQYNITVGTLSAPHYSITVTPGVKFEITPRSITSAAIELNPAGDQVYDGGPKSTAVNRVALTVGAATQELTSGTDYNTSGELSATDAGTYTVTSTGTGNYKDTTTAQWRITGALPSIDALPSAEDITYGQTLGNSSLMGGTVRFGGNEIAGSFAWKALNIMPSVADSNLTEYWIEFTPQSNNYSPVSTKRTLRINPAPARPSVTASGELAYDGTQKSLVIANDPTQAGGEIWYVLGTDTTTPPGAGAVWSRTIPVGTQIGT